MNINTIVVIMMLLLSPSLFGEDAQVSQLTVFFPAGGTATLSGGDTSVNLTCGQTASVPAGTYHLSISHPDYSTFEESADLQAGGAVVLLPHMKLSPQYVDRQTQELLAEKDKIKKAQAAFVVSALIGGGLSVASLGGVGWLEWLLSSKTQQLDSAYLNYEAASAADAPGLWTQIQGTKSDITNLRSYEYIALGSVGAFAVGGGLLALLGPSTDEIDWRISLLKKAGEE